MTKTIHITARISPGLKKDAESVFKKIGMTTTDAISVFFTQVALQQGIPFDIKIPNKVTIKAMRDSRSGKGIKRYKSSEEMFKSILGKNYK